VQELLLETMKLHNRKEFETYFLALDRVSPHHPNTHPLSSLVLGVQDNEMVDEYVDTFVDLSATPYRYACYTSAYTSGRSLS